MGRLRAAGALAWVGWALWTLGFGCSKDDGGAGAAARAGASAVPDTAATFFVRGGVLYGRSARGPVALVAVFGEGPARDTLPLAWPPDVRPEAGFLVGDRIAGFVPSPDSLAVVFWTSGVHSLVGATRVDASGVQVLDFLLESMPVTGLWAPVPHYVALLAVTPTGDRDVRVYELRTGDRLALPWEAECEALGPCSAVGVHWEGGSLLAVDLRVGEGEIAVPYEVDVGALVAADTFGDEER